VGEISNEAMKLAPLNVKQRVESISNLYLKQN